MKIRYSLFLLLIISACTEEPIPEPEPFDDTVYTGTLHDSMAYFSVDSVYSAVVSCGTTNGKIWCESRSTSFKVNPDSDDKSLFISIISYSAGSWSMYFSSNDYQMGIYPLPSGIKVSSVADWYFDSHNLNSDTSLYYPDTLFLGMLLENELDTLFGWIEFSVLDYRTINIIGYAIEK